MALDSAQTPAKSRGNVFQKLLTIRRFLRPAQLAGALGLLLHLTLATAESVKSQLARGDYVGAVARFEIFPGDPISEKKLVRTGQGYMSAVLDKGKRGISVAVEAASASGGFIMPNDRVDIVSTRQTNSGIVSETIVHNVKVLAINLRLGETGKTGAPADPDTPNKAFQNKAIATLELEPEQGETVINAAKIGSISLSLRSIADFAANPDEGRRRNNQNVRLIRFGSSSTVVSSALNETAVADGSVSIEPTTYEETDFEDQGEESPVVLGEESE